ncbi:MAG TPA: DUF4037 domain-containing protein [Spirochaetales bacterium]|nr:DUF4037 domain-containing protein [Spirochaetales bacterium]
MRQTVEKWSTQITEIVSGWPSVEAVTLGDPLGEDVYDPHFFLSLDVYYTGNIPSPEERCASFTFGGGFEFSPSGKKDRFLIEEVPIRIEYIEKEKFAARVDGKEGLFVLLRENGSYPFYRILHSRILFSRSSWFEETREKLENLPDSFWTSLRTFFLSRLEHHFSDLEAASIRQDPLLFLVASGSFVRVLCSTVFIINRTFEPSLRVLQKAIRELPVLPESFHVRLENFLRCEPSLSLSRKSEIAGLLVKSLIHLV